MRSRPPSLSSSPKSLSLSLCGILSCESGKLERERRKPSLNAFVDAACHQMQAMSREVPRPPPEEVRPYSLDRAGVL